MGKIGLNRHGARWLAVLGAITLIACVFFVYVGQFFLPWHRLMPHAVVEFLFYAFVLAGFGTLVLGLLGLTGVLEGRAHTARTVK